MARYFIGENSFYPTWTKGGGRWVIQRVFTTVRGFLGVTDTLARPSVSNESLVWVPKRRGIKALLPTAKDEATSAIYELQHIPLVCAGFDWAGSHPHIEVSIWQRRGPVDWRLRCPNCHQVVGPDIDSIDQEVIIEHWKVQGRPTLDPPGAAATIASIRPIKDFEEWLQSYQPMENELAYVGQQLWPCFAEFIEDAKKTTSELAQPLASNESPGLAAQEKISAKSSPPTKRRWRPRSRPMR